jgi:membrane fusion protein, multidrug efflux system
MFESKGRSRGQYRPIGSRLRLWGATTTLLALLVACGPTEPAAPPPLEISVVEVIQRDQPIEMEMVGQTSGSSDIPIRARVEGVLLGMHFIEGRAVEEGQLLYEIDPVEYESVVVETEGNLAEARTSLAKAEADLNRIRPLAEMKAVSQSDLDAAVAYYEAAIGALQSARARVEQAEIQLGYTKISSPISGRIGISEARVGEFVGRSPNPVVLNFVSRVDPIRVRFSIDERSYMILAKRLRDEEREPGDQSQAATGLELILADGATHPYRGHVVGADASVDPQTGTFTFEADFSNPEELVLAGQFARVRAIAEVRKGALLIPSRCVTELQGNDRVFVIDADGKAEVRPVEMGPTVGNLRIVESGLKAGERVALDVMRLRPGMQIQPKLVQLDASGDLPPARTEAKDTDTKDAKAAAEEEKAGA